MNGCDSMSPTVPPISVMMTSGWGVSLGLQAHAALDLVGDVRDDLHGVAEVLAAPLLGDDGRVDLAGRDVRRLAQVDVEESLVVPDVEVGLGAVVGHEDLAVLERVHRSGIDVQVGIELLHHDPEAARREEVAEAGGREPLAQRGNDTTGHEDVLGRVVRNVLARKSLPRSSTTGFKSNRRSPSFGATCPARSFVARNRAAPSDAARRRAFSGATEAIRAVLARARARSRSRRARRADGPSRPRAPRPSSRRTLDAVTAPSVPLTTLRWFVANAAT